LPTISALGAATFQARATDGTDIAGDASSGATAHAIYWASDTSPAVDLGTNPAGATTQGALLTTGVSGTTVIGYETVTGGTDGIEWTNAGTTPVASVLASGGNAYVRPLATNGSIVVGFVGATSGAKDAVVWDSNGNMTNLGALDPGYTLTDATSIGPDGTIYGFGETGTTYTALEWTLAATPEPSSMAILAVGAAALLRRRSRGD
jgi:uncharacterized membrane protein